MSQKTYMYDAQWQALLSAIGQGDTSALVTALNSIATAIQNQQITLDFSNLNSDTVLNSSSVTGDNVSDALDKLNSNLNNISETSITTLTEYSGIFFKNKIYKKSNVVYIDLEIVDSANKISLYNQIVQIGTLPIDYAPKTRTYIPFAILDVNTAGYITSGSLLLGVDGSVSINIPRNCSFGYCQAAYMV